MKSIDQLDTAKLKSACTEFNTFIEDEEVEGVDKIRTTGVKNEEVLKAFVDGVKAVAKAKRGDDLPEGVILMSNDIFAKPGKKDPAPKKEKKKAPPKEKSRYGHIAGTQAAKLDDAFCGGATYKQASEAAGVKAGRARLHLKHLKDDKGLTVTEKPEGCFTVKEDSI
ncbi:MAG: hypothetical protein V3T10_04005 [Candidatus Bathyarchaeia archaeon]